MSLLSRLRGRPAPPASPSSAPTSIEKFALMAAQNERLDTLNRLLDRARPAVFDRDQALALQRQIQPALRWAMEHERIEVVDVLLSHPVAREARAHAGVSHLLKLAEHAPGTMVGRIIREMPPPAPSLGRALQDVGKIGEAVTTGRREADVAEAARALPTRAIRVR